MEGSYRGNQNTAWSETCLIVCFILVQEFGLSKAEPLAHSMDLIASMLTFGWIEEMPAILDEYGVVIDGNRRMIVAEL
jgi:hypothetical protein